MTKLLKKLPSFLLMLLSVSPLLAAAPNPQKNSGEKWLFAFISSSGSLKHLDAKDHYLLTLYQIEEGVAFTDRPTRDARSISMKDFMKIWTKGVDNFQENPPNAALEMQHSREEEIAVFTLTNPDYNENTKTLTFDAVHIKTQKSKNPLPSRELQQLVPQNFGHTLLVIDDMGFGGGF